MSGLHLALAVGTGAIALVAVLLSAWSAARGEGLIQPWTDRATLAAIAVLGANWLVGAWMLVTGGRPADPLHYLYAVLALAVLPVARFAGAGPWDRRRPMLVALGGLVLGGLVIRLVQTGGT